jgi:hypothetical protein
LSVEDATFLVQVAAAVFERADCERRKKDKMREGWQVRFMKGIKGRKGTPPSPEGGG